jgi:hypothetical protein
VTKTQLSRYFRNHVLGQLYDDSDGDRVGTAIYSLSDPRDIRAIRYVGQTKAPKRRFFQHLNTARLWLPDERLFWVTALELRPLYEWIRELYLDEHRLPTMVVYEWLATLPQARIRERSRICECLQQSLPLLNVEAETSRVQMTLI